MSVAEHLSEDEQLESLKKWWRDYGVITVAIITISVGGYFGSIFYKENKQEQSETASSKYQDMMEISLVSPGQKLGATQYGLVENLASELKGSFESSQYANYAALLMAKLYVEKNDLDAAIQELNWALDHSDESLGLIVKLRLARVEASRGNIDLAQSIISDVNPKTMASAYSEAQGDFYMLKKDTIAAYDSYLLALVQSQDHDSPHIRALKLKLNQVTPLPNQKQDKKLSGEEN